MTQRNLYIAFIFTIISVYSVSAQTNRTKTLINAALHGWEYEVRAGFSIGGTSPIPLPAEIRSINSYNPSLAISLEGNMTKWIEPTKKWGIVTGSRLESRKMKTDATVKNYNMEIIASDGGRLKGNWTGKVSTNVNNSYLTLPVLAAYKINDRWHMKAGVYASYILEREFSGNVYDGYLREENPTGDKVSIEGDKSAKYDFSEELRHFQWGVQAGADWLAFKHLKVYADLTWGLNDIFKKDFTTISFAMYPIYLNIGFAYAF